MRSLRTTLRDWLRSLAPPLNDTAGNIDIDRDPTEAEETGFFRNQKDRREKIANDSDEQDMGERKRYADNAYGITQAWIGFLIVVTIAQFSLKPIGLGLSEAAFITVFTTTTASIFGFWVLVGRYLFQPRNGTKS